MRGDGGFRTRRNRRRKASRLPRCLRRWRTSTSQSKTGMEKRRKASCRPTGGRTGKGRAVTTNEVSALTGATLRMLQWWSENGLIPGMRVDGNKRVWGPEQVQQAVALASLPRLARNGVFEALRRRRPEAERALSRRFLLFGALGSAWHTKLRLIAASDDRDAIIRRAVAAPCGVRLVYMPVEL
jgi:hypothetical protein